MRAKTIVQSMAGAIVASMAVVGAGVPTAAARDIHTYISPEQCRAAHNSISMGQGLPDPSLLRLPHTSLKGDTLHLYVRHDAQQLYGAEILKATQSWTESSGGKIKFEFHDQNGEGIVEVSIQDNNLGAVGVTSGVGSAAPYIHLRPGIGVESRVYLIAHEIGHAMGLSHGCVGDLMKGGGTRGPVTLNPTATDVAAVIQGKPEFSS